ncbi:hypothetical protein, partial [Streptomyces griseus]|uniref:hypothetical protein n=1 Tax=Streptomyces griseus TaxID=1911 RepID=UPI0033E5C409
SEGVSSKMHDIFLNELTNATELNINTFDVFKEDMPYFLLAFLVFNIILKKRRSRLLYVILVKE